MKTYRQGAVGALMDEYERVVAELEGILEEISDADFELVRDTETRDENCRSIQTILTHVVGAGYGYAGMMRDAWGMERVGRMYEPMTRSEAPGVWQQCSNTRGLHSRGTGICLRTRRMR